MLDHRVVTLHPKIHGGILADLGKDSHRADLETHGIKPFDLVVSNLYPFLERPGHRARSTSADPRWCAPRRRTTRGSRSSTSPTQYGRCSRSCAPTARCRDATRRALALEAFARTAAYDAAIVEWLSSEAGDDAVLPQHLDLALERTDETLRYGENPHQRGARYRLRRHDELVGRRHPARRPRAQLPQLLRRRRRVAAGARPR